MAPNPNPIAPPTAPAVRQQQMPPLSVFAGAPGGAPTPDMNQPVGMDLVESSLNEVAAKLMQVAKVLAADSPELMPILQKMVQAGSMLMNEVKTAKDAMATGGGGNPGLAQGGGSPEDAGMTMDA